MKTLTKFFFLALLLAFTLNAFADWQCYSEDKKGHYWMSPGMTQEHATEVAMSYCSGFSPNGGCHISKCASK